MTNSNLIATTAFIAIFSIGLPHSARAQEKPTLAVLDFEGFGISQSELQALTNRLRSNITKLGTYTMIERGLMAQILNEQDFQMTGCTSDECAVEIGQLLGAQFMLSGTIGKVGNIWTMEMRIVDVETGAIIRSASYDTQGEIGTVLTQGMAAAAAEITGVDLASSSLASTPAVPAILNIRSSPPGASITVDNNAAGTGNVANLEIRAGTPHKITASLDRYLTADSTVNLGPGERSNVTLTLLPKYGTVEFKGEEGATLKIDGKRVGKTPTVSRHTLQMGSYNLAILKPGFHKYESPLSVDYNQVTTISYTLAPKSKFVGFSSSLLLPGGGQLYMGEKIKAVVLLASSAALAFLAYSHHQALTEDQDAYDTIKASYDSETDREQISIKRTQVIDSHETMTQSQTARNQMFYGLATVWAVNLIDISF